MAFLAEGDPVRRFIPLSSILIALTVLNLATAPKALANLDFELAPVEIETTHGKVKIHAEISRGKSSHATFVLVNGLIYDIQRWNKLSEELIKKGHTVIRYSFAAQPESLRLLKKGQDPHFFTNGLDLSQLALELSEVLTQVGLKKKAYVVGLSYGASVASEFAIQYPEMTENLILMSPLVVPLENYDPSGQHLRTWLSVVRYWENAPCDFYGVIYPWLCQNKDFWYDSFYNSIYEPYLAGRIKGTPEGIDPTTHKKSVFHLVRAVRDFDLRSTARELADVHFLVGGEDTERLKADQEQAWKEIAPSQRRSFIVFQGVHHAIPDESPKNAARILHAIASKDPSLQNGDSFEIPNAQENGN